MANFIKTQSSFAYGAVSPEFFCRDNIDGLSKLENMDVLSGGGLTRRCGLEHIATLQDNARLVSFSVSEHENYILAIMSGHMLIYSGNKLVGDLFVPWSGGDLMRLQYAQRFDTIIFVHPDYPPQILTKSPSGTMIYIGTPHTMDTIYRTDRTD